MRLLPDFVSKILGVFGAIDDAVTGVSGTPGFYVSETAVQPSDLFKLNPYANYEPGFLESKNIDPLNLPYNLQPQYDSGGNFIGVEFKNNLADECFLAGTMIDMWDGSKKPIEQITPNDLVVSYDKQGNLVPGRVKRTMQNRSKYILDFHGTMTTPGHAFYCTDGKFKGQHVPILDILRSDGAIQQKDGTAIRAATNCRVGSLEDQFVWAITGTDEGDRIVVKNKGRIRLGTRAIMPDGRDLSILESLTELYGPINENGISQNNVNILTQVFHWSLGDDLPTPEDYVLQRSAVTMQDIYQHGEWERGFQPQMPAPYGGEAGGSISRESVLQASTPPNIPPSMRNSPNQPTMSRKQRRAFDAKQRKAEKREKATLH